MPVGADGVCAVSDEELEAHIRDCGRLMVDAFEAGNRQEALDWLQAQNLAVKARRPEYVAQLERERGLLPAETFVDLAEQDLALVRKQAA